MQSSAACGRIFCRSRMWLAKVLLPEGRLLKSVELLRANQTAAFTMEGAYAVIALPAVHIAEVVHLSFA